MSKIMPHSVILSISLILLAPSLEARSEKPSMQELERSSQVQNATSQARQEALFSERERQLINQHYAHISPTSQTQAPQSKGKKPKKLPKGLQKKLARTGELPPGWEKKVARGEVLGLDVYRVARPIPIELERRLPVGPLGSKVLEVEGKIIRVMEKTRLILDVFDLIRHG